VCLLVLWIDNSPVVLSVAAACALFVSTLLCVCVCV